ncbi:MAG TPA: hypothetical protein VKU60_12300 [Chloroflexota bacterium]|nr:hypothetical protein [Chloroflexota bacterium]
MPMAVSAPSETADDVRWAEYAADEYSEEIVGAKEPVIAAETNLWDTAAGPPLRRRAC